MKCNIIMQNETQESQVHPRILNLPTLSFTGGAHSVCNTRWIEGCVDGRFSDYLRVNLPLVLSCSKKTSRRLPYHDMAGRFQTTSLEKRFCHRYKQTDAWLIGGKREILHKFYNQKRVELWDIYTPNLVLSTSPHHLI